MPFWQEAVRDQRQKYRIKSIFWASSFLSGIPCEASAIEFVLTKRSSCAFPCKALTEFGATQYSGEHCRQRIRVSDCRTVRTITPFRVAEVRSTTTLQIEKTRSSRVTKNPHTIVRCIILRSMQKLLLRRKKNINLTPNSARKCLKSISLATAACGHSRASDDAGWGPTLLPAALEPVG